MVFHILHSHSNSLIRLFTDYSELVLFSRDLKRQLEQYKPEDPSDYAVSYLKMVHSCNHVIGTGFSYVLESNHNRKSFVFCLLDAFKEFNPKHETTSNDFFYLIEPLCPGFPKSFVFEACLSLPSISGDGKESKYNIFALIQIISCQILFDEWLKLLDEYFRNENNKSGISLNKAKSVVDEFQRNLPISILQPRWTTLFGIMDSLDSVHTTEINFDDFKKLVFSHDLMGKEIQMLVNYPFQL